MRYAAILFLILISLLPIRSTYANDQVTVRTGIHAGYERIVFDWPNTIGYSLTENNNQVSITFNKAGIFNPRTITGNNFTNFRVNKDSPAEIKMAIREKSRIRHFQIRNKVIVDIYNSDGNMAQTTRQVPPQKAKPVEEKPLDPLQKNNIKIDTVAAPPVLQSPLPPPEPHVILLTSIQKTGMAAYERGGFLWLVFDNPALKTPPVIQGPHAEQFPALERIETQNSLIYRLPKPEGYYFYGEGGGLIWRLVMTPNPRNVKPKEPDIDDVNKNMTWPIAKVSHIIEFKDPFIGDNVIAITSQKAEKISAQARQYVDMEVLPSFIGLAIIPKADDLVVSTKPDTVEISRPSGLFISPSLDRKTISMKNDVQKEQDLFRQKQNPDNQTIYNFNQWQMGGIETLEKNRQILFANMGYKEGAIQVEDLLTLAKLHLANDRATESLGYLGLAEKKLPGIEENAQFIAIKAAGEALASQYDIALRDFSNPALNKYQEIQHWKCFVLAGLEDWQQANDILPDNFDPIINYPNVIQQSLFLSLAEVALRAGKTDKAKQLLATLASQYEEMSLPRQSKWDYLSGELARQTGDYDTAIEKWANLLNGSDDYYRAKAGLSKTRLELNEKKITSKKAIDLLEGLRYSWRGDELETLINYRLGEAYILGKDYLKGFSILRNAISLQPDTNMAQEITQFMTEKFESLFTNGALDTISPLDAISIYEEFKELTPPGKEGDIFVQKLAERLVDVDLLNRAAELLDHQITHRLSDMDKVKAAIRLGAIRLLDNKPEGALRALDIAEKTLSNITKNYSPQKKEIHLLKARALSKMGRSQEAMILLDTIPNDTNVTKLLADIAWQSQQWDEAANAFQDLMRTENISSRAPLKDYQATLILNRGIALNLSGNRVALANLRGRYADLMAKTNKRELFDLVTRPRQLGMLSSRESMNNLIEEVDLFGDFLQSYKKIQ